jgi:hypothetical protein
VGSVEALELLHESQDEKVHQHVVLDYHV